MIPLSHLLPFLVTSVVVILIPGPSVLFVIGRALGSGRRVAVLSAVGNAGGVYVQVLAVAFGVGALAERSVAAFTTLKLVGGVYLIYLGVKTFRARRSLETVMVPSQARASSRRSMIEGFTVGVTNPKTIVFMAAILPEFADRAAGHLSIQLMILGIIFAVTAIICDSGWAFAAGSARNWFARSPRRLGLVGGFGGLAIVAIGGAVLLTGQRK